MITFSIDQRGCSDGSGSGSVTSRSAAPRWPERSDASIASVSMVAPRPALITIAPGGAASVVGSLVFGIGTAANNGLGSAQVYTTDALGHFTTTFAGTGTGSIAVNDTTASTTTPCSDPRPGTTTCTASIGGNNDVGTLSATPAADSTFAGWSSQTSGITGCSGTTCSFSMGGSQQSVTATFTSKVTKFKVEAAAGTPIGAQTAGAPFSGVVATFSDNDAEKQTHAKHPTA